nr:uncharacterized protein LOC114822428 [Malus domestica]
MDFVGQIHSASSKGHTFIIVATNDFTKWVDASAVKNITSATVKKFIETKILHRFRVSESNGQTEASNKIMVSIIKRTVAENPEKWHERLGETLWAYMTFKRTATGTTPYALTFGQDVVIPMEINVSSVRIHNQFGLHSEEYVRAICQKIEDLDVARIEALNKIREGKKVVARAYNKRVKLKNFKE